MEGERGGGERERACERGKESELSLNIMVESGPECMVRATYATLSHSLKKELKRMGTEEKK